MNNKKKMIIAGSLAAFLAVGGTAAFFTSSDSIANIFNTGTGDNPADLNAGINVQEDFYSNATGEQYDDNTDGDYGELKTDSEGNTLGPTQVLPGQLFTKKMRVKSNVDYDQYLKAKIVITVNGEAITDEMFAGVDPEDGKAADLIVDIDWTGWNLRTPDSNGYNYYYDKVFKPGANTNDIVKAVSLSPDAGNWWKGKKINVELHAESIQATTDAWETGWSQPLPVPAP